MQNKLFAYFLNDREPMQRRSMSIFYDYPRTDTLAAVERQISMFYCFS